MNSNLQVNKQSVVHVLQAVPQAMSVRILREARAQQEEIDAEEQEQQPGAAQVRACGLGYRGSRVQHSVGF